MLWEKEQVKTVAFSVVRKDSAVRSRTAHVRREKRHPYNIEQSADDFLLEADIPY